MTIFEMNERQIWRALKRFSKTNYGKGVFAMNFAVPLLLAVVGAFMFGALIAGKNDYFYPLLVNTLLFMQLFALGCRYFYAELKEFLAFEEKKRKR